MSQKYQVKPNEVLSQIAAQFKFHDGGAAIWQANRAVIGDNPEVLAPGTILTIPDPTEKAENKGTGKQHNFLLPPEKKNLCVTLQSPQGEAVTGWKYAVRVGSKVWTGKTADSPLKAAEIPAAETEGRLQVQDSTLFGLWGFDPELIELNIGGLDPLAEGETGRIAVQKILSNLGFYNGPLDGNFSDTNEQIRPALRAFQRAEKIKPAHGMADTATCERLIKAQGNTMPPPKAPEEAAKLDPAQDRTQVLALGATARTNTENVTTKSGYQEPTDPPVTGGRPRRKKLGQFQFFPHKAFVAPANPGEEDKNPNVIRMPAREFLFLDCGRWLGDARDFGLIWGPHVYLCQYASPSMKPDDFAGKADSYGTASAIATGAAIAAVAGIAAATALCPALAIPVIAVLAVVAVIAVAAAVATALVSDNATESAEDSEKADSSADAIKDTPTDRLDMQFFQQMNAKLKDTGSHINIVKHATADWASPADFNWDKVLLVVPDMHLMNGDVVSVWRQKTHDFQPELDFLDFVQNVIHLPLKDSIQFVQIGDSYDLWVGCAPRLFQKNDTWEMKLKPPIKPDSSELEERESVEDPAQTVRNWIKDIQGVRGNWVQDYLQKRGDGAKVIEKYEPLLRQESEENTPTAWVCKMPECPGHARPGEKCTPYACGRISPPCPTHINPDEVCKVESRWLDPLGDEVLSDHCPTFFDGEHEFVRPQVDSKCCRLDPPCPGHSKPEDCCAAEAVWKCRAASCPGHRTSGEICSGAFWNCGRVRKKEGGGLQPDCAGHSIPGEACEKPGWLNPAEAGFRLLDAALQERMVYVYGNHDNYLIIEELCDEIPARVRYFDGMPGIFVEHGHRMEGTFFEGSAYPMPVNFDGQPSGYETTIGLYNENRGTVEHNLVGKAWAGLKQKAGKPVADEWAGIHDQPQYRGEMAQIWLGRQAAGDRKPPHIFVIGHTHMPNLWYVSIEAWRS